MPLLATGLGRRDHSWQTGERERHVASERYCTVPNRVSKSVSTWRDVVEDIGRRTRLPAEGTASSNAKDTAESEKKARRGRNGFGGTPVHLWHGT